MSRRRNANRLLIVLMLLNGGCRPSDDRLIKLSRESLDRQAEQNAQMARQSEQVAQATRQLVEGEAEARRELARLQQQVQAERASLDRQRETLETQRHAQGEAQQRDTLLAHALLSAALLLAATLPLVLCGLLVRGLFRHDDDSALGELLIGELAAEQPVLLPSHRSLPPRLEDHADSTPSVPTGLPAPDASGSDSSSPAATSP